MTSLQFLVLYSLFAFSAATCGGRKGGLVCCSGYSWNHQLHICIKCPPGHFGVNCTGICVYPTYGERCRNICSCKRERCDKANGCLDTKDQHTIIDARPAVLHHNDIRNGTQTTGAQHRQYNKTDYSEQQTCLECNASYTKEIHHHHGHNAVQLAMIGTTACLSLVLVIGLLSKVHNCCKRSTESKKGSSMTTADENYDELDERVQASELKGNFHFDEVVDAKIAFDKSQKRYYIEFSALSPCSSDEREIFRCQSCAVKEECAMAAQPRQEKKTTNSYILPILCNAEEPTWNSSDEDTQSLNPGCRGTQIQFAEEDTYLVATGAQR